MRISCMQLSFLVTLRLGITNDAYFDDDIRPLVACLVRSKARNNYEEVDK